MGRRKKLRMGPYRVKVSLKFFKNERTGSGEFCSGISQLLQGVIDFGSINKAAKSMGMAYSKAWKLIKECERGLGYPLLIRSVGAGSIPTPEGKKLMMMHQTLQTELDDSINTRLCELLR
jgi:molybdate transport system regulatory protein